MPTSKESALYGFQRPKRLRGDKEISSNTTLSFSSQLSSLINSSANEKSSKSTSSGRAKPKKEDIFSTHNRNTAKRAKRDHEDSPAFAAQKHTTNGETLDRGVWERSRRKMEEKARLYAAMKRGDVEDMDERFAVDFDRKWAEKHGDGGEDEEDDEEDESDVEDGKDEVVEYTDEFGRTRQGTKAEAARADRAQRGQADMESDRFTARPVAPANVIRGDTVQHQAFNPDQGIEDQMEALAKKRDRSLTPPPDVHFDAKQEIRQKGTGFFNFSEDPEERKRQMLELEKERAETEKRREEKAKQEGDGVREDGLQSVPSNADDRSNKRKADALFDELDKMMGRNASEPPTETAGLDAMDAMQRIEAALAREKE